MTDILVAIGIAALVYVAWTYRASITSFVKGVKDSLKSDKSAD